MYALLIARKGNTRFIKQKRRAVYFARRFCFCVLLYYTKQKRCIIVLQEQKIYGDLLAGMKEKY